MSYRGTLITPKLFMYALDTIKTELEKEDWSNITRDYVCSNIRLTGVLIPTPSFRVTCPHPLSCTRNPLGGCSAESYK